MGRITEEINILSPEIDSLEVVNTIANYKCQENPFHVCDVNNIIDKYKNWTSSLPRVEPHFGMQIVFKIIFSIIKNL